MPGKLWSHGGDEWQKHILTLLKRKYGPEFVEIPDEDRGDYGLEGFSRNGYVYQCYVAENPLNKQMLYTRQRDKISRDIRKFIENKDGLLEILGPTKISNWILVVPYWNTKELLKHAENKAKEVRELCLPHVKDNFYITVVVEDYFAVELAQILDCGLTKLLIEPDDLSQSICYDYIDCNNELVNNLERKVKLLANNFETRERLKVKFISYFIRGQNVLYKLNSQYPELYSKAQKIKGYREEFLETSSMISRCKPADIFNETIENYKQELTEELKGLEPHTIEILTYEAISDWLLRCPLDFPYEVCI
jgi:hypothetical protein